MIKGLLNAFWQGKAQALAEAERLRIDPDQLVDHPDYPTTEGGFGSVRVASLGEQLVAVKELRISGDVLNRKRIAMVRPYVSCKLFKL